MTAKPPTPQAVSALLKRAGFKRSERQIGGFGDGFVAEKDWTAKGAVRVGHRFWSLRGGDRGPWLAKYAEAITAAGWAVEAGERELVVTAPRPGWRYTCQVHGWGSNLIPCPDDRHKAAGTEQGEGDDEQ
jgi:hypothetical protein